MKEIATPASAKFEKAYICSPYRAKDDSEHKRNLKYAKKITKRAIEAGYVPITPHLYITRVLNDNNSMDRVKGMKIAIELLRMCDVVIIGTEYGVSEGMMTEIREASKTGTEIINERDLELEDVEARDSYEYARQNHCLYCGGKKDDICTGIKCGAAFEKARKAFLSGIMIEEL